MKHKHAQEVLAAQRRRAAACNAFSSVVELLCLHDAPVPAEIGAGHLRWGHAEGKKSALPFFGLVALNFHAVTGHVRGIFFKLRAKDAKGKWHTVYEATADFCDDAGQIRDVREVEEHVATFVSHFASIDYSDYISRLHKRIAS